MDFSINNVPATRPRTTHCIWSVKCYVLIKLEKKFLRPFDKKREIPKIRNGKSEVRSSFKNFYFYFWRHYASKFKITSIRYRGYTAHSTQKHLDLILHVVMDTIIIMINNWCVLILIYLSLHRNWGQLSVKKAVIEEPIFFGKLTSSFKWKVVLSEGWVINVEYDETTQ